MEHTATQQPSATQNMRVLIVGAGIAGLTLAALLKRRGMRPVLIEKDTKEQFNKTGYMLGLMPLGARVLNSLGLRDEYLKNSVEITNYDMYNGRSRVIHRYDMSSVFQFGDYQGVSRPKLIELLASRCDPPRFNTTVTKLVEGGNHVQVTFNDGKTEEFDLVVIADGIHSPTRELAFGPKNHKYRQTGWGGWTWYVDAPAQLAHTYREYWGLHSFLGLYIVEGGKLGVFLGGNIKHIQKIGHKKLAQRMRKEMGKSDLDTEALLKPLEEQDDLYFWNFHDCRSKEWISDNVVLLGDAGDAFLPTAGVGASMAMDSAAALDDELSRADLSHLKFALRLYRNRQQKRVEEAQTNSRKLGNLACLNSAPLAWLRNQAFKFYSVKRMLNGIRGIMEGK